MSARRVAKLLRRTTLAVPPLPSGRPNLVVTGFMGTGKTEAGRLAAAELGMPFVDTDDITGRRGGDSIAELFASRGEEAFRRLERGVLGDAARLSAAVISTGGGAVLDAKTFTAVSRGAEVAVLHASLGELVRRLASEDRPLLGTGSDIQALLAERAPAYEAAGEPLDTTGRAIAEVAAELAERYRRHGGHATPINVGGTHTQILIQDGALDRLGSLVADALPDTEVAVVVADPNAQPAIDRAARSLSSAGMTVSHIKLPSGEAAKTTHVVLDVWKGLLDRGVGRRDVVVAVGGGAALDTAGFAAATFNRGVPLVHVPTTMLAMADAAVGGKSGVDLGGVKNVVGAFHHPRLVVADPSALTTLSEEDRRTGLAEVVKCAVLASPLVLDVLAGGADDAWLVEQAVRVKAAYVAADPEDRGARHALNLGHTFAHAIEMASRFSVSHGQAVAIGLVAATRLGVRLGLCQPELGERVAASLLAAGLPVTAPHGLDPTVIRRAMLADKKRRGREPTFVIPTGDGAELVEGVDPDQALEAMP